MAVQADGKVLLGGAFTTLQPNGAASPTTRNQIARVNTDGTLDSVFDPNANGVVVYSVAVQADGKVLLGGDFTTLQPNGAPSPTTRNRIARVNANGTLDTGFDPNANDVVTSVAVQADGKVLLGGNFTTLQPNGAGSPTTRNFFARLNNDGATQSLTAPDTSNVLWSRGGAGPEVSQVTFEHSTNGGVTWTALGNGARVGTSANWQLTGLSLPTEGHLRARGRTTNGIGDGSSGLIEQIAAYTTFAPGAFVLKIVQKGTATYNAGNNTTSITMSFTTLPNIAINLEYSTNLPGWIAYTGNPVNSSPTGAVAVTFTGPGNQTATWNKKMFFRATTSP